MQSNSHKIIATIFLLFFVVNVLLSSFIFINFKINQEYISKNLCVEKELATSSCEGNCQLMKDLAVIEKGEDSDMPYSVTIESHITSLYFTSNEFTYTNMAILKNDFLISSQDKVQSGYSELPFQPPILL